MKNYSLLVKENPPLGLNIYYIDINKMNFSRGIYHSWVQPINGGSSKKFGSNTKVIHPKYCKHLDYVLADRINFVCFSIFFTLISIVFPKLIFSNLISQLSFECL